MRIRPPDSLKLDQDELLDALRERLAERMPGWSDRERSPTDPSWMLVEEAAWLVERLSQQLDDYPLAVLQQFVHMLGGRLLPARPAMGFLVVQPREAGLLKGAHARPGLWRFLSSQTEERDIIEFAVVEPDPPVQPARVDALLRTAGGELWTALAEQGDEPLAALQGRLGDPERSTAFDDERIEFRLNASNPESVRQQLEQAIEVVIGQGIGWLRLQAEVEDDRTACLTAAIDVSHAFAQDGTSGVADGGSLSAAWGQLEGSSWTPPVRVSTHRALPAALRGQRPLPGKSPDTIAIGDVPAGLSLDDVLEVAATPVPAEVVHAIWRTVSQAETSLLAFTPRVRRVLGKAESELGWLGEVVRGGAWPQLDRPGGRLVVHVALDAPGAVPLRVALTGAKEPVVDALGVLASGGLTAEPLPVRRVWSLPLPAPSGEGLESVHTVEIDVGSALSGVVLVLRPDVRGVFVNPILTINAPFVRDGRRLKVSRAVPETVRLLEQDLVTPASRARLAEEPLSASARALLAAMPLSRLDVVGATPILDFEGVEVDGSEGTMRLNAPDQEGAVRRLDPGARVRVAWYRRTDGAAGELEPGALGHVEQPPRLRPSLLAATNPLATWFGGDRETDEACRERIFGPATGLPVMPGDWERVLRQALRGRAREWVVRVWGHAERALIDSATWPLDLAMGDMHSRALANRISHAGPETLLVVIGITDGTLDPEELSWATLVIERTVERLRQRLPVIREVVVTRFWPLTLVTEHPPDLPGSPWFDLDGCVGELRDAAGRRAPVPRGRLLLNAGVVAVAQPLGEGDA